MKRLLGLLLVMGMAGCGGPPPDQYLDDEPLVALEKLEAPYRAK